MQTAQHDFARMQRKFDHALSELAHLSAGGTLPDVDNPMHSFNKIVADLCSREIVSTNQLDVLYEALDYFVDVERQQVQKEIANADTPFKRALFALAGHVLAERRRQAGNA